VSILKEDWDLIIKPKDSVFQLNLKEAWSYKYLLVMFVKRDIVSVYKQTVLGPIWFFVQPILTTVMFMIVFGTIAQLKTDGLPQIPFYLAGITIWNYFSETLLATSNTFISNANIFGKVYFPRLILPVSKVISGIIKFLIQFVLFVVVLIYYKFRQSNVSPDLLKICWVLPLVLLIMAGLGLGLGLILSATTTKYRDLAFLIGFGLQLGMYATPVIYPVSSLGQKYRWLITANPVSAVIEAFRKAFLGTGQLDLKWLAYSLAVTIILLAIGVFVFNKVEKTFMDTV
jgi:lipopolysaccharide transport system permease protein